MRVDDPRIAADVMVRSDGSRLAWLVSQADEAVTVKPDLAAGLRLMPLAGVAGSESDGDAVTPAPFGVGVFRLAGVPSPA